MDKVDKKEWEKFRSVKRGSITFKEMQFISRLHSKYFNHKYYEPCSCRPHEIKQWIGDLNLLYDGHRED